MRPHRRVEGGWSALLQAGLVRQSGKHWCTPCVMATACAAASTSFFRAAFTLSDRGGVGIGSWGGGAHRPRRVRTGVCMGMHPHKRQRTARTCKVPPVERAPPQPLPRAGPRAGIGDWRTPFGCFMVSPPIPAPWNPGLCEMRTSEGKRPSVSFGAVGGTGGWYAGQRQHASI